MCYNKDPIRDHAVLDRRRRRTAVCKSVLLGVRKKVISDGPINPVALIFAPSLKEVGFIIWTTFIVVLNPFPGRIYYQPTQWIVANVAYLPMYE